MGFVQQCRNRPHPGPVVTASNTVARPAQQALGSPPSAGRCCVERCCVRRCCARPCRARASAVDRSPGRASAGPAPRGHRDAMPAPRPRAATVASTTLSHPGADRNGAGGQSRGGRPDQSRRWIRGLMGSPAGRAPESALANRRAGGRACTLGLKCPPWGGSGKSALLLKSGGTCRRTLEGVLRAGMGSHVHAREHALEEFMN
jgi:hypothetical protein